MHSDLSFAERILDEERFIIFLLHYSIAHRRHETSRNFHIVDLLFFDPCHISSANVIKLG